MMPIRERRIAQYTERENAQNNMQAVGNVLFGTRPALANYYATSYYT